MNELSDNPVYEMALAYQKTAALIAAIELDLFTTIGAGAMTADALALRTGASPRGLRILCDYLTVVGMLRKQESTYSLTLPARRYLDRSSAAAIGSSIDFLAAPEMIGLTLTDPAAYVRRGGSYGLASLTPDHPVWVRFARAMAPFAASTAKRVAARVAGFSEKPHNVLDVAAGHGLYGIEIAKMLPDAVVTAVDWAEVLTVVQMNAEAAGVGGQMRFVAGNAFDVDWGGGFDLVLLAHFLHHFSSEDCVSLLRKVRASMSRAGLVLAVEFVPNPDRISPSVPAAFAFSMLAQTPNGDAYTLSEMESIARDAGFDGIEARSLAPTPATLLIFKTRSLS